MVLCLLLCNVGLGAPRQVLGVCITALLAQHSCFRLAQQGPSPEIGQQCRAKGAHVGLPLLGLQPVLPPAQRWVGPFCGSQFLARAPAHWLAEPPSHHRLSGAVTPPAWLLISWLPHQEAACLICPAVGRVVTWQVREATCLGLGLAVAHIHRITLDKYFNLPELFFL